MSNEIKDYFLERVGQFQLVEALHQNDEATRGITSVRGVRNHCLGEPVGAECTDAVRPLDADWASLAGWLLPARKTLTQGTR